MKDTGSVPSTGGGGSTRTVRGAAHFSKRVRQTPALFRNYPRVLADLGLHGTRWERPEITFRLRNGYTVHCPNADGARFPLYEIFGDDAYRMDELTAGIDPDAAVLDVGGQIGSFALAAARALPRARVNVYEASPASAAYVSRNIAGNALQGRVTVHAKALAGERGSFTFVDSGTGSGHNGLTAPDGLGREVTVPAETFDAAVAAAEAESPSGVQVVKMDVEGAEYDIILRSSPASWSRVRRMVMEYHPVPGHTLEELLGFLGAVGLRPVMHDPGTRAGLGVVWLAREDLGGLPPSVGRTA